MDITITQKDIEKAGIQNSHSGMLIDELAYSSEFCPSDNIYDWVEIPQEPYMFDYEEDLLENTKTLGKLIDIIKKLELAAPEGTLVGGGSNLQAGAYVALNNPDFWDILLIEYKKSLKYDGVDSISENFNEEIEEAIEDQYNYMYREWLHGDRSDVGAIYTISKYFTETCDGYYDEKEKKYTFVLSEYDIQEAKDCGYNKRQLKAYLLDAIKSKGEERAVADRIERQKRKEERERLEQYRKEQAEKERITRVEKLKTFIN